MRHSTRSPFAVIFDMDGVIVDSNPWHKVSLDDFFKKHGFQLSDEYIRERIYGRTNKEWIPALFGDLSEPEFQALSNEKEALFRDIYKDYIQPIKGLIPFLEALEANHIPMAIATSAPGDNVAFTLKNTGTEKFFNIVVDQSAITKGKPHPEIYLKTASLLDYSPQLCIVIEDSLSGIESAYRAGCKVIGITTTHESGDFKHTVRTIDDFTHLQIRDLYEITG